ncbi:MAG: hypothetical protein ACK53L_11055, partial [Pirellulaceae bacterium]
MSNGNGATGQARLPVTQGGIHRAILRHRRSEDWNSILELASKLRPAVASFRVVRAAIDAALSINSADGIFLAVNLAIHTPATGVERASYATQFVKRGYNNEG